MLAGDDTWKTGEVVKLWYRDDDTFEDGYVVPYQVLLDGGDLIFAPTDEEYCIRKTNQKLKKPLRFDVGDIVGLRQMIGLYAALGKTIGSLALS